MRKLCALFAASLLGPSCWAAYTYYQFYPAQSGWAVNGSGVTPGSGTGSVISTMAVPDGSSNYEAAMQLTIPSSGGTYTIYLEATSNALLTSATATGSFYAISVAPTLSHGSCTAVLSAVQSVSGSVTSIGTMTIPCRNGMTLHAAATPSGWLNIYGDPTANASAVYLWSFPYTAGRRHGRVWP